MKDKRVIIPRNNILELGYRPKTGNVDRAGPIKVGRLCVDDHITNQKLKGRIDD